MKLWLRLSFTAVVLCCGMVAQAQTVIPQPPQQPTYWYIDGASAQATSQPMLAFMTAPWRVAMWPVVNANPPATWHTVGSGYFQSYLPNVSSSTAPNPAATALTSDVSTACSIPSACTSYFAGINISGLSLYVVNNDPEIWKFTSTSTWSLTSGNWNCLNNTGNACVWKQATVYNNGDEVTYPQNSLAWKCTVSPCESTTDPLHDISGNWQELTLDLPTLVSSIHNMCAKESIALCMCSPARNMWAYQTQKFGGTYVDSTAAMLASGVITQIAADCKFFEFQIQLQQTYLTPNSTTNRTYAAFAIGPSATYQNYIAQAQAQYLTANPTGVFMIGITTNATTPIQTAQAVWIVPQVRGYWFNCVTTAGQCQATFCILAGVSPDSSGNCSNMPSPQPREPYRR